MHTGFGNTARWAGVTSTLAFFSGGEAIRSLLKGIVP
jgi:hypothetical protein